MSTASKGPLNYTTGIDPVKTQGECVALLVKHGANAVGLMFDAGTPTGLHFAIMTVHGQREYSLPVNIDGTRAALLKAYRAGKIPQARASVEQARRTAWRVLKDWLEAQLALTEAGVAAFDQVMLPYMRAVDGRTVYELFVEREQAALEAGSAR